MKISLSQIEGRLQELVEIHLANYILGRTIKDLLVEKLSVAMKTNLIKMSDGSRIAPNLYKLLTHPDATKNWKAEPHLLDSIAEILNTIGQEAGIKFLYPPTISFGTDARLSSDHIRITASHTPRSVAATQGTPTTTKTMESTEENLPSSAFLIVEGVKIFPLDKMVINIGRRLDNHLTIDDPRISRNHAQLRAIKGRYVVFDLNSTGGTYVNGHRINQSLLYPGDVISLAGVPLIYGQDNPPPRPDLAETTPISSATIDRPTVILKIFPEEKER